MVRPMVHSTKHYVQMSRSTVGTVSTVVNDLVLSVEGTVANAVDEVSEGSTIKAIFIELWIIDDGNNGSFAVTLAKFPSNTTIGFANANALGTWVNKKNILYHTQGLSPNDAIAQPIAIVRQWFKIPKSKQRFGLGDGLKLAVTNNSAQDMFFCGFATYKEYS